MYELLIICAWFTGGSRFSKRRGAILRIVKITNYGISFTLKQIVPQREGRIRGVLNPTLRSTLYQRKGRVLLHVNNTTKLDVLVLLQHALFFVHRPGI